MKFLASLLSVLVISATSARAHHGQNFILVEDVQCACCDDIMLLTNFEWERGADGSEFGFSPALFVGLTNRLSLSVEADFRDEVTDSWKYASVTPSAHFMITPPGSTFPLRLGISAGYQFGNMNPADETAAHGDEHAEEADHDHAHEHAHTDEEAHGHSHGDGPSIHAHGLDAFVGRFVIEGDLAENTTAVLNILSVAQDEGTAWGYAVGLRQKVSKQLSLGIEAMGDFSSGGWQELGGAAYLSPTSYLTVKLGASFGLNETTPDFMLRTGLVWRF